MTKPKNKIISEDAATATDPFIVAIRDNDWSTSGADFGLDDEDHASVSIDQNGTPDDITSAAAIYLSALYSASMKNAINTSTPRADMSLALAIAALRVFALKQNPLIDDLIDQIAQTIMERDPEYFPYCDNCGKRHVGADALQKKEGVTVDRENGIATVLTEMQDLPQVLQDKLKAELPDLHDIKVGKPDDYLTVVHRPGSGKAIIVQDNPKAVQRLLDLIAEARDAKKDEIVVDEGEIIPLPVASSIAYRLVEELLPMGRATKGPFRETMLSYDKGEGEGPLLVIAYTSEAVAALDKMIGEAEASGKPVTVGGIDFSVKAARRVADEVRAILDDTTPPEVLEAMKERHGQALH